MNLRYPLNRMLGGPRAALHVSAEEKKNSCPSQNRTCIDRTVAESLYQLSYLGTRISNKHFPILEIIFKETFTLEQATRSREGAEI
jgi:hypothetical protein